MTRDFSCATPRQDGDRFPRGIQSMLGVKFFARKRRSNVADQRVAYEFDRHSRVRKEFLFERKNAERQRKSAANEICAPRPPCPELRADVIDVFDAKGLHFAGEPQVKAGK